MELHTVRRKVGTVVQIDFLDIDDVKEMTTLDFGLSMQWEVEMNPLRAASSAAEYPEMSSIEKPEWVPDVQFYGTCSGLEYLLDPSYFRYKNTGFCYFNWKIEFVHQFHLHRFPFDRQQFEYVLFSTNSDFVDYDAKKGVPDTLFEKDAHDTVQVTWSRDSWIFEKVEATANSDDLELNVVISASRSSRFYLQNIVFVVFLIVVASLTVVAMDVADYGSRLGNLMTSLLTTVAFKFVISSWIPPVSYQTLLDSYMIAAFLVLGLCILISFFLSFSTLLDDEQANRVNEWAFLGMFVFWLLLHFLIVLGASFGIFYENWKKVEMRRDLHEAKKYKVSKLTLVEGKDEENERAESSESSTKNALRRSSAVASSSAYL